MRNVELRRAVGLVVFAMMVLGGSPSRAQTNLKGANWLRTNHDYSNVPSTDYRRVVWNLEIATTLASMGTPPNLLTLYNQYGIKTLVRLGYVAKPTPQEYIALSYTSGFDCSQISTLISRLDDEVKVTNWASSAIAAFIVGNEPNLSSEWNLGGRAYGRVYKCYLNHWRELNRTKPLLAAGPGGCGNRDACKRFYDDMLGVLGTSGSGYAIHAYGQTGAAFAGDFQWQVDRINQTKPGSPIYITEFNPGAVAGQPLPTQPDAVYFDDCYQAVRTYNQSHDLQIKALLYFVDSPSPWHRDGTQCEPTPSPTVQTAPWFQASLCFSKDRRDAWLQTAPVFNSARFVKANSVVPAFLMPGQIARVELVALNIGTSTWSGAGDKSMFRLGATGGNGFTFTLFSPCGGYYKDVLDARAYTCADVPPNGSYTYKPQVRAPTGGVTNATLAVRMVEDGKEWFGNPHGWQIALGTAYCGTAVTQCILGLRPDILPVYRDGGWNVDDCNTHDKIVANWCAMNASTIADCNALKAGPCAPFNTSCRCTAGFHRDGTAIDPNGTFCGYRVCGIGPPPHVYKCEATGWTTLADQLCN